MPGSAQQFDPFNPEPFFGELAWHEVLELNDPLITFFETLFEGLILF
jgi:hypothetical protein